MLRVLPHTFKPVNNLICCKTGLMRVVKKRNIAIQLVLQQDKLHVFCCPFFRTLRVKFGRFRGMLSFIFFFRSRSYKALNGKSVPSLHLIFSVVGIAIHFKFFFSRVPHFRFEAHGQITSMLSVLTGLVSLFCHALCHIPR